jgi:hypothetical protein
VFEAVLKEIGFLFKGPAVLNYAAYLKVYHNISPISYNK